MDGWTDLIGAALVALGAGACRVAWWYGRRWSLRRREARVSVSLDRDQGGLLLGIPDPQGKTHWYQVTLLPVGLLVPWAVRLTKKGNDEGYEVRMNARGDWTCGCKAHRYRPRPCKHALAAAQLKKILEGLVK